MTWEKAGPGWYRESPAQPGGVSIHSRTIRKRTWWVVVNGPPNKRKVVARQITLHVAQTVAQQMREQGLL